MKYLNTYQIFESKGDKNQFFYTVKEILLEFFDDEGIHLLPDLDSIDESDYEMYLEPDKKHQAYGYYIYDSANFDAENKETDRKIKSLGVWNISREKVGKLIEYLEENRERIHDATGFSYTYHDEHQDVDQYDIYINPITLKQYEKDTIEKKLDNYSYKLKQLGDKMNRLPVEKRQEVFDLLDKLFKVVE